MYKETETRFKQEQRLLGFDVFGTFLPWKNKTLDTQRILFPRAIE